MAFSPKIHNVSVNLIKDQKYEWAALDSPWFINPYQSQPTLFYSINYSNVEDPSQYDESLLLPIFPKLFQRESLQNTKCITFWAKWTTDSILFDIEVNKELKAALDELLPPSYKFRLEGSISCCVTQRVLTHVHPANSTQRGYPMFVYQNPTFSAVINSTEDFDTQFQLDQAKILASDRQCAISKALFRARGSARLIWNWNVMVEWDEVSPIQINADRLLIRSYECDPTKDVTILLSNGREIKCHSFILKTHSPPLRAAILWDNGIRDSRTGHVDMKHLSYTGAKYLLPYFYGKKLHVKELSSDIAFELFQVAHVYDLSEGQLEKTLEHLFLSKNTAWYTPDVVMELYYMTKNLQQYEKLTRHCLLYIKRMANAIRQCDRYKELKKDDVVELLWTLLKLEVA